MKKELREKETELETRRLFETWLIQWKKDNPKREKPSGNEVFFYFYPLWEKTARNSAGWEWQDVNAYLKGEGLSEN